MGYPISPYNLGWVGAVGIVRLLPLEGGDKLVNIFSYEFYNRG